MDDSKTVHIASVDEINPELVKGLIKKGVTLVIIDRLIEETKKPDEPLLIKSLPHFNDEIEIIRDLPNKREIQVRRDHHKYLQMNHSRNNYKKR